MGIPTWDLTEHGSQRILSVPPLILARVRRSLTPTRSAMNLLEHPLLTVTVGGHPVPLTLPGLLSRLLTGPDIDGFPHLAAHQRGYLWRFLVRCAARGLRTAGHSVKEAAETEPGTLANRIRKALLDHTDLTDWALYLADPGRPAFLQPPTPSGKVPERENYEVRSCALLTSLIGKKEFERKSEVNRSLTPEAVVFALIEYQGGVVFGGRKNYESQFMGSRSGAGSGTPFMGAWIGGSHHRTFIHDVGVTLERWDEVARELKGEIWALWRESWNGIDPLPSFDLDPSFIPTARLVRLASPKEQRFDTVWFRLSEGSRVADHTEGGRLGDPFTPLIPDPKKGHLKVRGTLHTGYHYREVVRLLIPDPENSIQKSPSVESLINCPPPEEENLHAVFEGTAFEQGKTRGFHRRTVRLPRKAVREGLLSHRIEPIHEANNRMLGATSATRRALRSALSLVLSGSLRGRDSDIEKVAPYLSRLEEEVDRVYLDFLFQAAEDAADQVMDDPTEPFREWLFEVTTHHVFLEALRSLPRSSGRWFEEEVTAEAYLRGRLRKELDLPIPNSTQETPA